MKKERINALITLLDDPSDEIFNSVELELLKEEVVIVPQLELAWESTHDDRCQQRIENIIHSLQLKDVTSRLRKWAATPNRKLLEGAWLIARYQYPELRLEEVTQTIDVLRKDIWLELNEHLTPLEKVRIINHILFDVHGFSRNSGNPTSPQNSFICDVLDTKRGNPISLSVVYSVIAQRLGLPIYGVNLPKNFLLAWVDHTALRNSESLFPASSVLFYINPINKGTVMGRREIEFFIKKQKLEYHPSYYTPCSDMDVIRRMFRNLLLAYESMGQTDKSKEIRMFLAILDE